MHTLESFALSCGLKISKPFIYEKYYPLNMDNYIIIETNNEKNQAKNYDYWQEVVGLICTALGEKNIKILQMCHQNDHRIVGAYSILGLNYNQKAFLIKNSLLYCGFPGLNLQIASSFNKKIIGLYSTIYASQGRPYWSEPKDICLLQAFSEQSKPSYYQFENQKVINNIKPDEIANQILQKLNINYNIKYKYTFIGNNYNQKTIEIVPNKVVDNKIFNVDNLIVRMDIEFNENILKKQLEICKCIIITNKEISEELVNNYKNNIIQIFYKIEKNHNPNFISLLKNKNINFILASELESEDINNLKINYMDLGLITKIIKRKKEDIPSSSKYYKSNRFILSNNNLYMSEAAIKHDKPIKDFNENVQKIINDELFWNNSDNYAFLVD